MVNIQFFTSYKIGANAALTLCSLDQQACGNPCQVDQNQDEVVQDDDADGNDGVGAGGDCEGTKIKSLTIFLRFNYSFLKC
jgi:hypothetical protein